MKTRLHFKILILLSIVLLPSIMKANTEKTDSALSTNPTKNCIDEVTFSAPLIGFTLVDADTNTDLFKMKEGGVIDIETFGNRKLNIRVDLIDFEFPVGIELSYDFVLTGPINRTWTENFAPYALFGDIKGDYNGKKLPAGDYHLMANDFRLEIYGEINFSVGADPNTLTSFNLIAAESDLNFDDRKEYYINDGQVFDQNSWPFSVVNPVEISINANTNSYATGSVHFELSGPVSYTRVENVAPFTLFGDFEGDYYGQILPVGIYTLVATPYREGEKGIPLTIQFSIADIADLSFDSAYLVNAKSNLSFYSIVTYEITTIDKKNHATDDVNIALFPGFGGPIGSAYLSLEGPISHSQTENFEPYAIFGDIGGDYSGRPLPVGTYKLTATPYTGPNRTGKSGHISYYNFEIIDTSVSSNKFFLIDAENKRLTALEIDDGMILNKNYFTKGINIEARTVNKAGSVALSLSGPVNHTQTENEYPHTLFGDMGTPEFYNSRDLPTGTYILNAESYSGPDKTGEKGEFWSASFTITDGSENLDIPKVENAFIGSGGDAGPLDAVLKLYHNANHNPGHDVTTFLVEDSESTKSVFMQYENYNTDTVISSLTGETSLLPSVATIISNDEGDNKDPLSYSVYNLLGFKTNYDPFFGLHFKTFPTDSELGYNHENNILVRFSFTPYSGVGGTGVRGETTSLVVYLWKENSDISRATKLSEVSVLTTLFPNPAKEFTQIRGDNITSVDIDILDFSGRTVKTLHARKSQNNQIDVSDLKKGLYIVRFQTLHGPVSKKLIVN